MIISRTPLRISICGGGTDIRDYYKEHSGLVVSTAINKYIFVIITKRFDELIYINYSKKEIVKSVSEIEHELLRECLLKTGIEKGVEITMLADIPSQGSGLGSSSSLTVGLLNAFYHFQGELVTAERLAKEACEIEIDILQKPIGKQDQYIAAYGGLCKIQFNKDDSVEIERLRCPRNVFNQLNSNLTLHYTNITRKASDILSRQKKDIPRKLEFHDRLKQLAVDAIESLESNSPDEIGKLLATNWELKKQLASNISNREIDLMYETAVKNGALGAKISGAGGGGFLLSYCKKGKQDTFRKAMAEYREMPITLEPHGSKIIFDYSR